MRVIVPVMNPVQVELMRCNVGEVEAYRDGVYYLKNRKMLVTTDNLRNAYFELVHEFDGDIDRVRLTREGTLLVGVGNKVMRSGDGGKTWVQVLELQPHSYVGLWQNLFVSDDNKIIIGEYGSKGPTVASDRVFVSDDDGQTWTQVLSLTSDLGYPVGSLHIHCVYIDPYTGHWWLCTGDTPKGSILRSTDEGENWEILHHGMWKQTWFPYPESDGHFQPVSIWADEEKVYFGPDHIPWGIKSYDKSTGEFKVECYFPDYGLAIDEYQIVWQLCETDNYVYASVDSLALDYPAPLFRMDKKTRKWVCVWRGWPEVPRSGSRHGIRGMVAVGGDSIVLNYYFESGYRIIKVG